MALLRKEPKYISLKEIAEISGYTPDYIGQLIRSGKLPGKQIYTNVSWVTTEEDLRAYLERKRAGKAAPASARLIGLLPERFRHIEPARALDIALYVTVGFLLCFVIVLFYVLATSLERHLHEKAMREAAARSVTI